VAGDHTSGHRPLEVAPTLALIKQLQNDRRSRDAQGIFFVEGVRNFVAALDHGFVVDALLYSERLLTSPHSLLIPQFHAQYSSSAPAQ
jgi:TrmH family RNA methyltransferase